MNRAAREGDGTGVGGRAVVGETACELERSSAGHRQAVAAVDGQVLRGVGAGGQVGIEVQAGGDDGAGRGIGRFPGGPVAAVGPVGAEGSGPGDDRGLGSLLRGGAHVPATIRHGERHRLRTQGAQGRPPQWRGPLLPLGAPRLITSYAGPNVEMKP